MTRKLDFRSSAQVSKSVEKMYYIGFRRAKLLTHDADNVVLVFQWTCQKFLPLKVLNLQFAQKERIYYLIFTPKIT